MLDLKRLKRFASKEYRDEYLSTVVRAGVSYQISAIRRKISYSQTAFASKIGKPQSVVSRLENAEYGKVTIQTLLDIATALDIALLVRFVDYPTFFKNADRMTPADLAPDTIFESLERATPVVSPEWNARLQPVQVTKQGADLQEESRKSISVLTSWDNTQRNHVKPTNLSSGSIYETVSNH